MIASAPFGRRAVRLLERNVMVYRRIWIVLISGFFEPLFYLLGIGFGIGSLVGPVVTETGHAVSYAMFIAPALMASSAMNGAIFDSTYNIFFKLRHQRTYDAILSTPIGIGDVAFGEVSWALIRGTLYSIAFIVVMLFMGLIASPWAILAVPAAMLIGFTFASIGLAITTFMRSWQDFDVVQLIMLPLLLFSASFFPISVYPPALRLVVELTPLYHGIDLIRGLTTGEAGLRSLGDVAYLVALGSVAFAIASRRLGSQLLK